MSAKAYQNKLFVKHRQVIKWLYDDKCYIKDCKNTDIEIHHIDKNNTNNDLQNLIPLCNRCHKIAHLMPSFRANIRHLHVIKMLKKVAEM